MIEVDLSLDDGCVGKTMTGGAMDAVRSMEATTKTWSTTSTPSTIRCPNGYRAGRNSRCIDIDECSLFVSICPSMAQCVNFDGTYDCRCPPGSAWNGEGGIHSVCHRIGE